MSTPFYVVDHKVGPRDALPIEEKRIVRRGAAEPLRLNLPTPGAPCVHTAPPPAPQPLRAPGTGTAEARPSNAGWLARLFRGLRHAPA